MISIINLISRIKGAMIYKRSFREFDISVIIRKPLEIKNPELISIGARTYIGEYAWLLPIKHEKNSTQIKVGRNVSIGHFVHIVSNSYIEIKDNVLIADRVFISDCSHEYGNVDVPIKEQNIKQISQVVIGQDSWIGENACILGASIGKHCVIGANCVVNKDIPDFCVVAGNPAKIIKRFDIELRKWIKV